MTGAGRDPMAEKNEDQRSVKAVDTSVRIIKALRELDEARLTELSDHLEISKSSIHRHLSTLQENRFVAKEDGEYRLGLAFLRMGAYARHQTPVYHAAKNKLAELAEETGEQTWCVVEENGLIWTLDTEVGENTESDTFSIGQRNYPNQTAGGKAILAHLPEDRVEEILDRYGLPEKTEHTITSREELFEELVEVRNQGYALNEEEVLYGLNGIAAPIKDNSTEEVLGAFCLSSPTERLPIETLEDEYAELITQTAAQIGVNMSLSFMFED